MLRIAVCDDSLPQGRALGERIAEVLGEKPHSIAVYHETGALLNRPEGPDADVVFLDIELDGENGIQAARQLNGLSPDTQVIFVTAHPAYAADIYEAEHSYFLLKPVQTDKLRSALTKAVERLTLLRQSRVILPLTGGTTRVFAVKELLYFERSYRLTDVHTETEVLQTPLRLVELEALLPAGSFARPHNSFLVGLGHVQAFRRMAIQMDNGKMLPVSNQKRAVFQQALAEYI